MRVEIGSEFVEAAALAGTHVTHVLLDGVTAQGAGAAVSLGSNPATIQITGTFVATVVIQGSLDNSNWENLATITAPGAWYLEMPWEHVRANVTSYMSGAISARART